MIDLGGEQQRREVVLERIGGNLRGFEIPLVLVAAARHEAARQREACDGLIGRDQSPSSSEDLPLACRFLTRALVVERGQQHAALLELVRIVVMRATEHRAAAAQDREQQPSQCVAASHLAQSTLVAHEITRLTLKFFFSLTSTLPSANRDWF